MSIKEEIDLRNSTTADGYMFGISFSLGGTDTLRTTERLCNIGGAAAQKDRLAHLGCFCAHGLRMRCEHCGTVRGVGVSDYLREAGKLKGGGGWKSRFITTFNIIYLPTLYRIAVTSRKCALRLLKTRSWL